MADDRYKVVVGMGITQQQGNREFADFGIVYSMLKYDQLMQVQAAFAKHAPKINESMKPLVDELVQMGVDQIPERMGDKTGKNR